MRRADNLTTFMCRLSWNLGPSTSWNPQGLSRLVQGLLYLYFISVLELNMLNSWLFYWFLYVWDCCFSYWKCVLLGGTPYADVATCEVGNRVMRGQRLSQLHCVDDDLYQLMLQCWQLDLDERPTFQEIAHILENMLEDSTVRVYSGRCPLKFI